MNYESSECYGIAPFDVEPVSKTLASLQYLVQCGALVNSGDFDPVSGLPPIAPTSNQQIGIIYTRFVPQIFQYWYGVWLPSTDLSGATITWPTSFTIGFTSVIDGSKYFGANFVFSSSAGYYKFYYITFGSTYQNGFGNVEIVSQFTPNIVQWGNFIGLPSNGYLVNQTPIPFDFDNYTYTVEESGTYVCNVSLLLAPYGTFVIPPGIALYVNNVETKWVNTAVFSDKGTNYQINFIGSLDFGDTIQIRYKCDAGSAWANMFPLYPTLNTFEISIVMK